MVETGGYAWFIGGMISQSDVFRIIREKGNNGATF